MKLNLLLEVFLKLRNENKKITDIKIRPNKKSDTLLKKYLSVQPHTQLKLDIYFSGFSTINLKPEPAFDQLS